MRVKLHFLAVLFTLLNAAIGADTGQAFIPPSPEDVKRWVDYDHNITLAAKAITRGDFTDWGKMVSVSEYNSRKETAISFVLAAYHAGTCVFNKVIPEYRKHAKGFSVKVPGSKEQVQPKVIKLPDGREIFVSIAGLGPGGGIQIAFGKSSNGKFDLLVARISDAQDGLREDERIKNPAIPRSSLSDIFQKFDAHVAKKIGAHLAGAIAPPASGWALASLSSHGGRLLVSAPRPVARSASSPCREAQLLPRNCVAKSLTWQRE